MRRDLGTLSLWSARVADDSLADDSMLSLAFVAAALAWSQPTLHRASPRAVLVQAQPAQHQLHVSPRARTVRAGGGPVEKLDYVPPTPLADSLAGLTVGFSLLSKAIASSAIAGVDPLVGLWSSVVMGVSDVALGTRPGVISGAAAVVVVPLGAMVATHGTKYIPLVMFLCAIFEGLFGFFKLAKLTRFISESVLNGFLNGLGGLLFMSQLKVFYSAPAVVPAVACAGICGLITELLPRVKSMPKALKAVPASLVGLAVATGAGILSGQPLKTLASTAPPSTFLGGFSALPKFIDFGQFATMLTSVPALKIAVPVAMSIAFISILETLLAAKVVDDMKGENLCTPGNLCAVPGDDDSASKDEGFSVPDKSVIALSAGNMVSSLLGGFGGCGLIPQTVLNMKSGGGGPLSSLVYAVSMSVFVIVLAPLVGKVSQAALAGIMLSVAFSTIQFGPSLTIIKRAFGMAPPAPLPAPGMPAEPPPLVALVSLAVTSYLCYAVDMATGIVAGVVLERVLGAIGGLFSGPKPATA